MCVCVCVCVCARVCVCMCFYVCLCVATINLTFLLCPMQTCLTTSDCGSTERACVEEFVLPSGIPYEYDLEFKLTCGKFLHL